MKKTTGIWFAAILCMIISVTVSADVQNKQTEPDYKTDYYMIVESKAGGIDIYANPDLEAAKLSEEMIPNGTALHIEGEVEDETHKRTWGYVQYHGMNGFVPLDDCRPAASRQEAIDSELYLAGRDNVNYQADYDIIVSEEDDMKLYQGPGEKYGTVPGVRDIKSGETLHITQDAHMNDGSYWGVTTIDGKQGWVNLDEVNNPDQQEGTESGEMSDSTENGKTPGKTDSALSAEDAETSDTAVSVSTEKPETPSAEVSKTAGEPGTTPSAISETEEKPEISVAALSITPDAAESSEAASAPKAVPEKASGTDDTASGKKEAEGTPAVSEKPESAEVTGAGNKETEKSKEKEESSVKKTENSAGENAQETSAQTVKTSSGIPAPFLWIAAIAVGAAAGVLIYHFKKR
ncbi:MAG: GW dipeptide domain-containing protein [Lachnospiraceae bacterium]|nr:GW dipeptide domain-containing protein [Lachnospiraceae bacterium]